MNINHIPLSYQTRDFISGQYNSLLLFINSLKSTIRARISVLNAVCEIQNIFKNNKEDFGNICDLFVECDNVNNYISIN